MNNAASLTLHDSVAVVEFARPDRHNAINDALRECFAQIVEQIASSADVKAVVIAGSGPSFCSGADLSVLKDASVAEARRFMVEATWSFRQLERLPAVVIAAVHGYCLGGGLELVLHCDYVIASEDAVFGFPEVGLGVVTTAGSVARLAGAIGTLRASAVLLAGRRLTAADALAQGLASEVVSAAALRSEAIERARRFAAQPQASVRAMKQLVRARAGAAFDASFLQELEAFEPLMGPAMRR